MKKQLAVTSVLTAIAQLVAFLKLWFTARLFGVGPELDAYNLALVLPGLIVGVFSGALQTGLFPIRARLFNTSNDLGIVASFERLVLFGCGGFGLLLCVVLWAASSLLVGRIASASTIAVRASLAHIFPVMMLLVALNLIGDCSGYLLAMRNRFAIAAGAPITNGLLSTLLLAVWPAGRLSNLALGTILGVVLQVSICLWGLKKAGFTFIGPLPKWSDVSQLGKEMLSLGGWILPGVVFSNLVVSLPTLWVARYGEGAVSAFGYAYRLHSSGMQLLVMASSTLVLAKFSDLVVQKNTKNVMDILQQSSIAALLIGLVACMAVWLLGSPLLQALFGNRLNQSAADLVVSHWLYLTFGLPFAIVGTIFAKLWQAQGRPQLISIMAATSLGTLTISHHLLEPYLREYSLSLAMSVAAASVVLAGAPFLNHSKLPSKQ